MNLRKTLLKDWPVLPILLVPFVLIWYFWDQIPEKIGMHWNTAGEVDRWGEKGWDVFFMPLVNIGAYLLLIIVPYIDPKRKTDNRQKALRAFRLLLPLILTVIFGVMLFQWIGYDFSFSGMMYLAITALFLVLGNYMQALKPNYFIGIRTPWTLESEEIWRKTHRLGGKLWVSISIVLLLLWFVVPGQAFMTVFLVGVGIMALIPTGYSFYLYMKEKGEAEQEVT